MFLFCNRLLLKFESIVRSENAGMEPRVRGRGKEKGFSSRMKFNTKLKLFLVSW